MNESYAAVGDMIRLFREMTPAEETKAHALLPLASDALRVEARRVGKDLDAMIAEDQSGALANVAKSVTVDIVSRMIVSETDSPAMSQFSQSAMGYSVSGTYLSPGGGMFIKRAELARLGLRRQRIGVISLC